MMKKAWADWQSVECPISKIERGYLHRRLRTPLAVTLDEALALPPRKQDIDIVMVVTGFGAREYNAVGAALDHVASIGNGNVYVIQNGDADHPILSSFEPRRKLPIYKTIQNLGFGDACREGGKLSTSEWILFTQSDVSFTTDAVRKAMKISLALQGRDGWELPATVAPSGGLINDFETGCITEFGENVARIEGIHPVDWLAGYWMLFHRSVYEKAPFTDDYFLYFEDPDITLRAALAGSRPVVAALDIRHARSSTISTLGSMDTRKLIQDESRQRFIYRWNP